MEPASQDRKAGDTTEIPFMVKFIATGFFSGYIPWTSGTFGSIVGLLIYLIPGAENASILGSFIVLGFAAGVFTSSKVADAVGNRLTSSARRTKEIFQGGAHAIPDPSIVVIDEIVGMWISLLLLPKTVVVIVTAFVLFRLYDIIKPPPARQLEQIPNGWGIMLDDVAAGIYANMTVRLILIIYRTIF